MVYAVPGRNDGADRGGKQAAILHAAGLMKSETQDKNQSKRSIIVILFNAMLI